MKAPRRYFDPLAIGAPRPLLELPPRLERMIHFIPPHNEKVRAKARELVGQVDVILGNLEDGIPIDSKNAARDGLIAMAKAIDFGSTALWARVNALNSPWFIDDMTRVVGEIGDKLDVIMVPKIEGEWDIHFLDQYLALLEARNGLRRPILVHAILETAQGVNNVAGVAAASPRMQGLSLGPADLAASRGMKTTRVGGGHPGYHVLADPVEGATGRLSFQQDPWHYTIARMVDACAANGIKPFYGPFGDFSDPAGCEAQFRNAFLLGCAGAWTLHPSQIPIAKKAFSPDPAEVASARKILEVIPDGPAQPWSTARCRTTRPGNRRGSSSISRASRGEGCRVCSALSVLTLRSGSAPTARILLSWRRSHSFRSLVCGQLGRRVDVRFLFQRNAL